MIQHFKLYYCKQFPEIFVQLKILIFFIVETICYENNSLKGIYYNVSQNLHLQVIFSTRGRESR